MTDDDLGTHLVSCALRDHSELRPGLLESVYEDCLVHELKKAGIHTERQVMVPIIYDGLTFEEGFKVDILVSRRVVAELKSVDKLLPIHSAQLLTYLKLNGLRVGYLLNFNVVHMREGGIKRMVNG
jgi:GxxExxY protein